MQLVFRNCTRTTKEQNKQLKNRLYPRVQLGYEVVYGKKLVFEQLC
jgi:hypothetical protein